MVQGRQQRMHIAVGTAALDAHGTLPAGLTLIFEGEEESGSPSLGALLSAHKELLAADVIVVADS